MKTNINMSAIDTDTSSALPPGSPGHSSSQRQATTQPTQPHAYSSLSVFSGNQLTQICTWLKSHTYQKTSELILEFFHHKITASALARFYQSAFGIVERLDPSPDTAAAAAEILQHAATGNHQFTDAALRVLERLAFKLTLSCQEKPLDLQLLNRISRIIARARNTALRERLVAVQKTKCELRSEELQLKRNRAANENRTVKNK